MLRLLAILCMLAPAASTAWAHAFLDHASPAVGSSLPKAPTTITIWFTQEFEPAFSAVEVKDQAGNRVDAGDAAVDGADATVLRTTLKPLRPGVYKVAWRVVSIDTHATEGTFSFEVEK